MLLTLAREILPSVSGAVPATAARRAVPLNLYRVMYPSGSDSVSEEVALTAGAVAVHVLSTCTVPAGAPVSVISCTVATMWADARLPTLVGRRRGRTVLPRAELRATVVGPLA